MLYDPKWEVKADPLSLGSMIAWLETKPAAKTYDWEDCFGGCLVDQYGDAVGIGRLSYSSNKLIQIFGAGEYLLINYHSVCGTRPFTFGGALKRARKLAAKR